MNRFFMLLVLLASPLGFAATDDSELYYVVKEPFDVNRTIEMRAQTGVDFSNSYVNIFGVHLGALYLYDPSLSFGLEGSLYDANKKGSAEVVAEEIKKFGYSMSVSAPRYKTNALVRVTPLSGMINFFSSKIVKIDLSLLLRAGAVRYQTVGWGPHFGTGIETQVSMDPSFGIALALNYEVEKPMGDWLWRAGVIIGPTVRF